MILAVSGVAQAVASLNGTLSGVDSNAIEDDGYNNHNYAIDRTAANTFYWSAGSTVNITGTVDVRGLVSGSYLQIGLVDKEQANASLGANGFGSGYMFNDSAFATFYAGTSNYARLADNNAEYSEELYNPGATAGIFDFALDISSDGTMGLTLHGSSDVSTTYTFGTRDWWDGLSYWSGGELENGSYLIAQLWIDTGDTENSVNSTYDITGTSVAVPVPGAFLLGSIGVSVVGWLRRRRSL